MRKTPILAWILAGAVAAAGADISPEESLRQADNLEKEGSFAKALALYDGFLKQYPDHIQSADVEYRRALCFDSMGKPEQAVEILRKITGGARERNFRHRADAFMRLAKLQGEAKRYEEAVKTVTTLLKEGAGLYEDEAQNLCAGWYALLDKYDEAAVMFNVLRNKQNSPLAKEAAYKLAVVWIKAGNEELAKASVEEFAEKYPTHQRKVELFVRVARLYFEKAKFKSAVAVCNQVLAEFGGRPEAMEAQFIIALSCRESGNHDAAIKAFESAARMPQAEHNLILASEALFEIGQIFRKQLNRPEEAMEFYARAAVKSRDPQTDRQKQILEQSLFLQAEYAFQKERWSAALDLYMQLRKTGSEINVLSRIMQCQSKLDKLGQAALLGETDDERKFIEERIAQNPGTLLALQFEILLLDRKLEKATLGEFPQWRNIEPIVTEFGKLLTKYPPAIVGQQSLSAYIRMRMAYAYASLRERDRQENVAEDFTEQWKKGLALYEEALALAPGSLMEVEILEGIAYLAQRLSDSRKAFNAFKRLYDITGSKKYATATEKDKGGDAGGHEPFLYIRGLASVANTADMVEEAITTVQAVIGTAKPDSPEVREARFYLGELYYMKKRYSEAAREFKAFIKQYGPPQDEKGEVVSNWKKSGRPDEVLDRVYEAGLRVAHCWYTQGHMQEMLEAYRWIARNQNHMNPRAAEALYMTIVNVPKDKDKTGKERDRREEQAEALWKQIVNTSLDFGSKEFEKSFHPWIHDGMAVPFVKNAVLKSGELYSALGKHTLAAEIFKQYLTLFAPQEDKRRRTGNSRYVRDDMYEIANYAVGREYIQAGDINSMAEFYRAYVDDYRDSRFRPNILMLLGHYGTERELFNDARDAYGALLDEYGPSNAVDRAGMPIPVKKEARLREKSDWNGIRMKPPENWDPTRIRYALGYLYWKKDDWDGCRIVLLPFLDDPALRPAANRPEALFLLGRSYFRLGQDTYGVKALGALVEQYPRFKGVEEAYVDLAKGCFRAKAWPQLEQYYRAFVEKLGTSERRPYMDLYNALGMIGRGQTRDGAGRLASLAEADTYEDLKAEAYYHLGLLALDERPPNREQAFKYMKKSVDHYPQIKPMFEAGRCAYDLKRWDDAREYLDRCVREFPRGEETLVLQARQLLAKVVEEAPKRGR